MKKKQDNDVLKLFIDFQKHIAQTNLSSDKKLKELQMMKFKIKPLQGDIATLNFQDQNLIEALWSLGKLDEFYQKQYRRLKSEDKKTFFQLFNNLYEKYQDQLNEVSFSSPDEPNIATVIEMEIFKDDFSAKKKVN